MNAIEIMKANQVKYICFAKAEEEELLKNKAEAEKCIKEKDFVWLGVALEKMIKNNRQILEHNKTAKMWETSANIAIKERDAEHIIETEGPEKSEVFEKIGFAKSDMQVGQAFKTREGIIYQWESGDFERYTEDLMWSRGIGSKIYSNDIVEVYPMKITPFWKRKELKDTVKK